MPPPLPPAPPSVATARRALAAVTDGALPTTTAPVLAALDNDAARAFAAVVRRGDLRLGLTRAAGRVLAAHAPALHAALATNHLSALDAAREALDAVMAQAAGTRALPFLPSRAALAERLAHARELLPWESARELTARALVAMHGDVAKAVAVARQEGLDGRGVAAAAREALRAGSWRLERIARTEAAWAFNAAQAEAARDVATRVRDLHVRWTELVDDATGRPLDERVAFDSLALHGQVVPPGSLFTMPRDGRVSPKVWGRRYAHPPNRPNDRAVLVPWVPGSPVPAWRYSRGRVVPV